MDNPRLRSIGWWLVWALVLVLSVSAAVSVSQSVSSAFQFPLASAADVFDVENTDLSGENEDIVAQAVGKCMCACVRTRIVCAFLFFVSR